MVHLIDHDGYELIGAALPNESISLQKFLEDDENIKVLIRIDYVPS
jgi:hypothetical protein